MSTLKVDAIIDKDGTNTTTINGQKISASNTSGRNMLINGKFTISQRYGTSAATVNATAGSYTIDRWMLYTQSGNYSVQQVSEADQPDGFANACKVTVSSVGDSTSSSALAFLEQKIEGYNISSLNWGGGNTSTPKTCTLSFHVKSSVTGTYSVHFGNDSDRFYVSTYTINSANTWEKKTITLTGPTDGTWNYTTGRGLEIVFPLVAGSNSTTASLNQWISTEDYMSTSSVQWGDNAGATFYLTGVQFEEGSVATEFEHKKFHEEQIDCFRYYEYFWFDNTTGQRVLVNLGQEYQNRKYLSPFFFKVEKRANPTTAAVTFSVDQGDSTFNFTALVSKSFISFFNNSSSPSIGSSDIAFSPQSAIYGDAEL